MRFDKLKYRPPNESPQVRLGLKWYKRALEGNNKAVPERILESKSIYSESLKDFLLKFVSETIVNPNEQFSNDLHAILNSGGLTSIKLMMLKLDLLQRRNPEFCREIEMIKSNFKILEKYEQDIIRRLGFQRLEAIQRIDRIKPKIVITTTVRNNPEGIRSAFQNISEQKRDFPIVWLIVNNSSSDQTRKILDEIRDHEFVVVLDFNERSGWPVFGRNFVINYISLLLQKRAVDRHVYVGRLDCDDLFAYNESLADFFRKLNSSNRPAELVGKTIIHRDDADTLYPSNLRDNDPTIKHPWEILPAGISAFSGLTRADILTLSTLPEIPTIEDAFGRVLYEIIHSLGEKIFYDDQLVLAIKDETTGNNNRSAQTSKEGSFKKIDIGNYHFEGLRALYFEVILEITRQQMTGELYK